ncbi:hypothetical protein Ae201684_011782 [Aphanomyces euteiches]|uniref:Reverse transcriptase Ty1/copia-type domain-containing protein n=2 Tax=Aphanomyces euteiches TaxID=100861 RepID=A0A6G0WTX5_9STRA|nr:hypothetical protein Ae201684_011782 [Aphanomyces euteiches]
MASEDVPLNHDEAMNSAEADLWEQAEMTALDGIIDNNTFKVIPAGPNERSIKCHWVYNKKIDSEGKVTRFKARLVANGYLQQHGVDFFESYSPVVKIVTLRMILSCISKWSYHVEQCDVVDAYLQSYLPEEERVIMDQPSEYALGPPDHKLLLLKSLFGLKQSGYHWNEMCDDVLKRLQYEQSLHDPCLYTKRSRDGQIMIVCVYVDDFLVAGPDGDYVNAMLDELEELMKIKRQGPVNYLLGIKIERINGNIKLSQANYARSILKRFGMEQWPDENEWDIEAIPADIKQYQALVGSLIYLMTCTRPDLAHPVQRLSRYMHKPTIKHMDGAKRVLEYIKALYI